MGGIRRFKHRKPRKDRPKPAEGNPDWNADGRGRPNGGQYSEIDRNNALLEEFYRQQGICDGEDDLQAMLSVMRTDLPAAFRITGFKSQALALRQIVESDFFAQITALKDKAVEGEEAAPVIEPKCLPFYPDRLAWQLNITRKDIKREEAYFRLHNFLISETASGNISRQETVSMIPPLVLEVKPHHKVLDMCAAPGSKTAQLIEALHIEEAGIPEGMVVANDSDNSRCYMLVHQAKRLQSPCVIITNHDASIMPSIKLDDGDNIKFDRILCDVPCTGDGTLRKNADIWPKWNAANSANLHGIQFRIARRGLEMLAVGGRMVYSTCSLNPVENEAVIARILRETGDTVELVNVSHLLPGLKFKPGMTTWKPGTKDNQIFTEWEHVPEEFHNLLRPNMFPPKPEEVEKLHLERCMRILPHHQDTGGFFVAVLEKKAPCPWESKKAYETAGEGEQAKDGEEGEDNGANGDAGRKRKNEQNNRSRSKKPKFQGHKEDPYFYMSETEEEKEIKEIKEYYKMSLDQSLFLTRCRDPKRKNNLYFTSSLVRSIVLANVDRVKIVNTGVKAFVRCENKGSPCSYRLAQEGVDMLLGYLSDRLVNPAREDLRALLLHSDIEMPPEISAMSEGMRTQLNAMSTGSLAFVYHGVSKDGSPLRVVLVGWKGKATVRAYVQKSDRVHYLRLIGEDVAKYERNKFQDRREANGAAGQADDNGDDEDAEQGTGKIEDEDATVKNENDDDSAKEAE